MKWNRAGFPFSITLAECSSDQRAGGARRLTFAGLPEKAIVFTFITQQFLCELFWSSISRLAGIFFLGVDESLKRIDGIEFIPPYPSIEDFLFASVCIPEPTAILLYERDGKRPVLRSEIKFDRSIRLLNKPVHLIVLL